MTTRFDYHTHTVRCKHAAGTMEQYVLAAQAAGLSEIGFSDHLPLPRSGPSPWNMAEDQLAGYVDEVLALRKRFAPFPVRLGVEADYFDGCVEQTNALLARHEWDYVIVSAHHLPPGAIDRDKVQPPVEWTIDSPDELAEWRRQDVNDTWRAYFRQLARMAASGIGDIIGHCDLPKKYGFRPTCDLTDVYRETAVAFAAAGVIVELNTAGLRRPAHEIYPGVELLRIFNQAGVPITFGSDAHAPEEVAHAFDQAVTLAKSAGYTHARRCAGRRMFCETLL